MRKATATPAFPEMEHWSKTSLCEPQPLGRHKRRGRDDEAGASRAGSGKLQNVNPVSRKVPGAFSGGEETVSSGKLKRREREGDVAGGFNGGSVKNQKTTNVSPASRAENGGSRSSGGGEMTGFGSASRRDSTKFRRDWPNGTAPNADHRPRNVAARSPPREGMTRKRYGQESISKSGKANNSMAKKAGSTSVVKNEKPGPSSVKFEKAGTDAKGREKEKNKMAEPEPSEPRPDRKVEMVKGERTELQQKEWMKARETVMEVLESYREHCKILEKDKSELDLKRVDLISSNLVKKQFPHLFWKKPIPIVGTVPGIEIGDRFNYRTELRLARVHNLLQTGIDTKLDENGNRIAVSVVATDTGRYDNYMSNSESLVYSAQGSSKEDQRKKLGNKAMMKSRELKVPVRVIRTRKVNNCSVYFYDGLYTVQDMWEDRMFDGSGLKFKLVRIPGQPSSLVKNRSS